MLPLRQLVINTPQPVARRIPNPMINILTDRMMKRLGVTKFRAVYARTRLFNKDSTGKAYTLMIRNYGSKKDPTNFNFQADSQLWVHCSCPYFTYYLEVVLKLYNASDIYDSNGRLPKVRNVQMRPYLCKHLLVTILNLSLKDKKKAATAKTKEADEKQTSPIVKRTSPTAPSAPTAPTAPSVKKTEE